MGDELNLEWMNEPIDHLPTNNRLYNFACLIIHRSRNKKMTYKEMYVLLCGLNRNRKDMSEEDVKKESLNQILKIYKENNNNNLPKID